MFWWADNRNLDITLGGLKEGEFGISLAGFRLSYVLEVEMRDLALGMKGCHAWLLL